MEINIIKAYDPAKGYDIKVSQDNWRALAFISQKKYHENKESALERAMADLCETYGCPIKCKELYQALIKKLEGKICWN